MPGHRVVDHEEWVAERGRGAWVDGEPIVPDEARTFGMEGMFRQIGIYAHAGQLYEPVDSHTLAYYKEAENGQILEEGITEAGSMASFIAAGTAYSQHGVNMIPFFIYYSMFGLQRVGDLIWSAADSRARGFLMAATAGRTTLMGEGLQHQDGHSLVLASTVPAVQAYDPAFGFELAAIVKDGIRRMYVDQEDIFYYITVENEPYPMPSMPKGPGTSRSCGAIPIRRRTSACVGSSLPSTRTSPESGGRAPTSMWIEVVFPAPLGPRNPSVSPAARENETSSTASVSP